MNCSIYSAETAEFGPSQAKLYSHPLKSFFSKMGLEIAVSVLSESNFEQLVEMYDHFEPKRGAQGLPPAGHDRILSWLEASPEKRREFGCSLPGSSYRPYDSLPG